MLEVWHREVVTRQYCDEDGWFDGTSRADGQTRLRELINPVLAKLDPPLEMRSIGQIVGTEALGLTGLTDHPLPDTKAGDAVRGRVMDAVARFRDREATAEDRRSALEQRASVLEKLQDNKSVRTAVGTKDENALRQIANNYGIRHHNSNQNADYSPAHSEWIFHTFLAAIRLTVLVLDEG